MIRVEVAAAVILDPGRKCVLVSKRHVNAHQGNKWEFPGGKCEPQESFAQALVRELREELGIVPVEYHPFLKIVYPYPEKTVVLSVWSVNRFTGVAQGKESQPIQWMEIKTLNPDLFPPANRMIIQALRLEETCFITPDAADIAPEFFWKKIESLLTSGIRMLQFRSHALPRDRYLKMAESMTSLCRSYDAGLILNMPPAWWSDGMADGLHLTRHCLRELTHKPEIEGWLSASCHNMDELKHAQHLGVNFVFVSPVKAMPGSPDKTALGWQGLGNLLNAAQVPVYALGGMTAGDLCAVKHLGGFGIAGISAFWEGWHAKPPGL